MSTLKLLVCQDSVLPSRHVLDAVVQDADFVCFPFVEGLNTFSKHTCSGQMPGFLIDDRRSVLNTFMTPHGQTAVVCANIARGRGSSDSYRKLLMSTRLSAGITVVACGVFGVSTEELRQHWLVCSGGEADDDTAQVCVRPRTYNTVHDTFMDCRPVKLHGLWFLNTTILTVDIQCPAAIPFALTLWGHQQVIMAEMLRTIEEHSSNPVQATIAAILGALSCNRVELALAEQRLMDGYLAAARSSCEDVRMFKDSIERAKCHLQDQGLYVVAGACERVQHEIAKRKFARLLVILCGVALFVITLLTTI